MEKRLSIISIIVEQPEQVQRVNELLHQFSPYIVGRMGLPIRERQLSLISVVVDAPVDLTSALSGKLGMIDGVTAKTLTARS